MTPGDVGSQPTHPSGMEVAVVVKFLLVVHPNFDGAQAVGQRHLARVWRGLGVDVAHVGARVDLQAAAALPDLKGNKAGCITALATQKANRFQQEQKRCSSAPAHLKDMNHNRMISS